MYMKRSVENDTMVTQLVVKLNMAYWLCNKVKNITFHKIDGLNKDTKSF